MTPCRKKKWIMWWVIVGVSIGIIGSSKMSVAGEPDGAEWVSKIVSIQGKVLVRRHGQTLWQLVRLNDTFFAGDQIHVEGNSRAAIVLGNDALMRLDQNSFLIFTEIEQKRTFIFKLLEGAANFFSHRPRSLKILTPFVNGVIEGTEFLIQVDSHQTRIELFEGRILAQNDWGILELSKGDGAVAQAGKAPQRYFLVRPRESVQWAMYYPPVLALEPAMASADVNQSLTLFSDGQITDALARLESIEPESRDATFYVCRAAIRLHVGRIAQAQSDIEQSLTMDPKNGNALALKAVIAVVQNRVAAAVDMARQAVQHSFRSASVHIALSYALQSQFKLTEALDAAQEAVAQASCSGLAWARLADLLLSVGALDQGLSAAKKAVALAPRTAHAHTILGFARLTRIETGKAREAFNHAIDLDSADPLPRLGLGLVDIRDGDLAKGRSEIEIAAGLDPGNSLIRSYLGKAYFDEKRDPQDGQQFEIAKTLDPNDPTPWFYDAIRKQTLNRPVEALQDLQQSIDLNDYRAVYRSRLLLDQDLAARGVSLARIYDNLRFDQLAVNESTKSLSIDPSNYSAHNLLFDTYSRRPRHESARVSELLQSQLLQPISQKPIQPESSETDLNIPIATSPTEASFNEFGSLFELKGMQLTTTGVAGSNDTLADQVVLSGLFKRFSYSLGQFHYETDGFRENNELQHDLYNLFAQCSVTPKVDTDINLDDASYRLLLTSNEDLTSQWYGVHLYSDISFNDTFHWTVGASYIDFKDGQDGINDFDEFNPKLGLQWRVTDTFRLRLATMQTVKRSLIFNQTLEPTQVAGFNQFFDDFNGTVAKRYGIGLDFDLAQNLYCGFEISRRDLDVPRTFRYLVWIDRPSARTTSQILFEDQQEDLYHAYLYWTALANWSISGELQWERFQRDPVKVGDQVAEPGLPDKVETLSFPLTIRWFNISGLFANAGATFVAQKVDLPTGSSFDEDEEEFIVVDARSSVNRLLNY